VAIEEEIGLLDVVVVVVVAAGVVLKGTVLEAGVLVTLIAEVAGELMVLVTLLVEVAGELMVVVATVELGDVGRLVGSTVDEGVGTPAGPHAGNTERMVAPPTAIPALLRNSLRVSTSFRWVFLRILLLLAAITISLTLISIYGLQTQDY
jgi:hypothetical protein